MKPTNSNKQKGKLKPEFEVLGDNELIENKLLIIQIEKDLDEFKNASRQHDESVDRVKLKMRGYLQSLGKVGMKAVLTELDSERLKTMCRYIAAIENEDYEICQAINEILEERKNSI